MILRFIFNNRLDIDNNDELNTFTKNNIDLYSYLMEKKMDLNKKIITTAFLIFATSYANAGVMFNSTGNGLGGGSRWDASARTINGVERSLDGGLRYSVQGGSMESFRDLFSWQTAAPTVAAFTSTIQSAFDVWTAVDPVSGLGSDLNFVADLSTGVVGQNASSGGGFNMFGAEIDLFATSDAYFWNVGNTGRQAETWTGTASGPVDLTSGTVDYAGSLAISGADILINNNTGAEYTLDLFRRLLAHEIGHALGLGDVDVHSSRFIDDNYDGSNTASKLSTLTNSWASKVDVLNPANSPLAVYDVGTSPRNVAGVDILMESYGLGIATNNPIDNIQPLSNDDFGMRQLLYPYINQTGSTQKPSSVPEPSSILLFSLSLFGLLVRKRNLKAKN